MSENTQLSGFCRALLARPGVLTRDDFEGRRARWVSPIRLCLVFSVAYFGLTAIRALRHE